MRFVILFIILLMPGLSLAQEVVPVEPQLKKGINVSNWLANAQRQSMDERDFEHIKKAGFDNIRLPVKPDILENKIAAVDKAALLAAKNDLTTVIDLHPDARFMKALETNPAAEQKLITLWTNVASHYKNYRTDRIVFELLNEPQYYGKEKQYNALVARLVKAIREIDTQRILIIAAPLGSSIEGLQKLDTLSDTKIIYDFHFYQPYMVTHQGIHRGFETKMLRYFHDVPYPSALTTKESTDYAENATDSAKATKELNDYIAEMWDAEHIEQVLKPAKAWADMNKVKILCGEFGVLRNHIDKESRYRWIMDVRKVLESNMIGWQLWDYADLDGIVTLIGKTSTDPVDGSVKLVDAITGERVIENEAIIALGLIQPVASVKEETKPIAVPLLENKPVTEAHKPIETMVGPTPSESPVENQKALGGKTVVEKAQPSEYPSSRKR